MATKAVEKAESAVPDLRAVSSSTIDDITGEDIALPRLYIGQFMSEAVKSRLANLGDIYIGQGADDPDPKVMWETGSKDDGVLFYVVGMRKGKSYSDGGALQLFDYDDPSAPADAWVTYNYTALVPDYDEEIPVKFLLTRTGRPAALTINKVLKQNAARGPAWINAFRMTTATRNGDKGEYAVARIQVVEPKQEHVDIAGDIALAMLTSNAVDVAATGEEPAI